MTQNITRSLMVSLGALLLNSMQAQHMVEPRLATEYELEISRLQGLEEILLAESEGLRGGGDSSSVFFYEDFANGFAGNNGFGQITVDGSPDNSLWQYVDASGDGFYFDATASGVQPPAGPYSSDLDGLESATAANGWMIFDNDYWNDLNTDGTANNDGNYLETEGFLELPVLDMSGLGSVLLSWEQYFRYCCRPSIPLFVEVSTDNWASEPTIFEAGGDFVAAANQLSSNPLPTSIDISCAAAGESEVSIRFAYRQVGQGGYSTYFWGLDDIAITEVPEPHDLNLVQLTNGDIYNLFEYRVTPMSQAIPAADGGLLAGVLYRNEGSADQTNCVITVEVLDAEGNVLDSTQTTPFVMPSFANNELCPGYPQDTMYIATGWEPEAPGEYVLRATMASDSVADAGMLDMTIEYTDCEFGHDDPGSLNLELRPRFDQVNSQYFPTGYGNRFTFHNEGTTLYGLGVAFGPSLSTGIEFEIRWYEQDPTGEFFLTDSPYELAEFTTDADWSSSPSNPVYYPLAFEDEIEVSVNGLTEPGFYAGTIITELEWEGQLTVLGNSDSDSDNSTVVYARSGGGFYTWFASQTATPAIRLITCPVVSVDVLGAYNGVHLQGNYPNPTNGETRFTFTSDWGGNFMIEIRDLQGRLVDVLDLGARPAGEHTVVYDASALADGMYTFSLLTGDARVTKKMRVQH